MLSLFMGMYYTGKRGKTMGNHWDLDPGDH